MDCYIVRIYRREEHDHRVVAGLVETVGMEKKERFKGPEELWSILCSEKGRKRLKKKTGSHEHVRSSEPGEEITGNFTVTSGPPLE